MPPTKNHSKHDLYDSNQFPSVLLRSSAKRERPDRILFSSLFSAPNDGCIQTRRRPYHERKKNPDIYPTRATAPTEVPRLSFHGESYRTIHGLNRIFHNDTRGLRAGKAESAQNWFRFRPCAISLRGCSGLNKRESEE